MPIIEGVPKNSENYLAKFIIRKLIILIWAFRKTTRSRFFRKEGFLANPQLTMVQNRSLTTSKSFKWGNVELKWGNVELTWGNVAVTLL
jgi:hypothetical protein